MVTFVLQLLESLARHDCERFVFECSIYPRFEYDLILKYLTVKERECPPSLLDH